jgi:hypothetical protein
MAEIWSGVVKLDETTSYAPERRLPPAHHSHSTSHETMRISVVPLISLWHLHPAKPITRYALYLDYLRLSEVQPAQLVVRWKGNGYRDCSVRL